MEVQILSAAPNLYMAKRYRRTNPKVIALIIEIVLFVVGSIVAYIFSSVGKPINNVVLLVGAGIFIFALLLTLSLIRYDAMRDIRESDINKDNVPIYTDNTTLLGHDIKEESERDK